MWWLRDADGKLQPAIGWTPEELEELAQIKLGLKQREKMPRFVVQWMSATGAAKGDHAELKIELKILVRDDQGVRVPLRLNQASLQEAAKYEGTGKQFLEYEEGGDGYVSYIRGGAEEVHHLTLNVLVPLIRVGNETRLKLATPRATNWELKLQVPEPDAVARVSDSVTLLSPSKAGDSASEFTLLGHGGDVELAWHQAGDPAVQTPTVLEAVGEILATADGRTIDLEARLNVRSYGGQFDRLQVRLPKGAVLSPTTAVDYTVTPVPKEAGSAGGQLVDVALSKKTAGPEEIRLTAQMAYEAASSVNPVDVAGFEVVGAARQWGYVGVCAEGDWHIRCEPDAHVRQVETLPEWLRARGLVAGFEYFRQPFSLMARVVPRETRISVEPEYVLLIDAAQVRLQAKLKYTIRGAKAFRLDVELPQWQVDEVGPDNLVNVDGVEMDKNTGVLSIPLVQPSVGQLEVTIRAKQPIQPQAERQTLAFQMPRPAATSLGPAAVVVLPADNVELTPNAESTVGLVRQQIPPAIELPKWQQAPLFYRVDGPKGVFAADFRVRSREISVDVRTQIAIQPRKAQVEQRLAYKIAYEPTDRFTLDVPRGLAAANGLQVQLGEQVLPLVAAATASSSAEDAPDRPVQKHVVLPAACIGNSELLVRYTVDLPEAQSAAGVDGVVPLVMPCDGELSGNTVSVKASDGLRVYPRQRDWRPREEGDPQRRPGEGLTVSAPQRTGQILLNIRANQRGPAGSTVVSREWIQTWLLGGSRQDRAVFRFTSTRENLEVVIPAGAKLGDVELLLDGQPVSGQLTPSGQILVPLGSQAAAQPRQLEIRYHFVRTRPGWGTLSLELPRLGQDVWIRRMYWQLILPSTEHVMVVPSGFTAEYRWRWNGLAWGRQPVLDQAALESWSGAQAGMEPPVGANSYLFSSLGAVGRSELQTATRSLIVLTASGMALVAGLLLIYVPMVRHPLVLLILAIALLGAVTIYPGPALLLAQAASLGVLLTFLAALLQRSAGRRRVATVPLEPGSSALFEKGSTQVQHWRAPAGSHVSTETAPPPAALPVSDSSA